MATGYVANWGNDNNDGLSWETAKRTMQAAVTAALTPIYSKGLYSGSVTNIGNKTFYGNNETIIEGGTSSYLLNATNYATFYDIVFRNAAYLTVQYSELIRASVRNCMFFNISEILLRYDSYLSNSIVSNANLSVKASVGACSIHSNNKIFTIAPAYANTYYSNNIISNCYVALTTKNGLFSYNLFVNSQFKFTGGGLGTDETAYSYPTGSTDTEKLQNLRYRMSLVYGGTSTDYLLSCKYYSGDYNDIFVDADNNDFHLVPNCLAANMNYNGDFIGALAEAEIQKYPANFSNIINIDSSGYISNQLVDSFAESGIGDFGHVRKVIGIFVNKNLAKRNGQSLNSESDLGASIATGSNILMAGALYMIFDDTITLDNAAMTTYTPFQTFIAVDEGSGTGLGFSGNGVVKEVLIDNYKPKVQMKFHKTDATLATANTITCYETEEQVMVNIDGNGDPLYGDADDNYDSGTAVALSARYWQSIVNIKANNIPARVV